MGNGKYEVDGGCGDGSSYFFQAEDGIRVAQEARGLGDMYKRPDANVRRAHDGGLVDPAFDVGDFLVQLRTLRAREIISDSRAADGDAAILCVCVNAIELVGAGVVRKLALIPICRCRRPTPCISRWSAYQLS